MFFSGHFLLLIFALGVFIEGPVGLTDSYKTDSHIRVIVDWLGLAVLAVDFRFVSYSN